MWYIRQLNLGNNLLDASSEIRMDVFCLELKTIVKPGEIDLEAIKYLPLHSGSYLGFCLKLPFFFFFYLSISME